MKKITKLLAVVLALILAMAVCASCGSEHKCQHKCEKCGLCTDSACTNDVCKQKCQGHNDITDLSVRDYVGKNGIVTAANPYAANAGLQILKAGGNAFDAAVAVSFALGVAECDATGLGGGGLMIAYNTKTSQSLFYNFREFAPEKVSTDVNFYTNGKSSVSVGKMYTKVTAVPTQVAGLLTILQEQGTMTRQEVMQPAIDLATNGVVVTPELASNISNNTDKIMRSQDEVGDVLLHFGMDPYEVGETIVQKDLAETLQYVADNGKEGFYTGEIAKAVVETAQKYGSAMTLDDLTYAMNNYPRKDSAVISGSYRGYNLLTCSSPSTGGTMVLEMLNMLEKYGDVKKLGHNTAEYINLLATVEQLAYGDKEKYLADTSFPGVTDYSTGLLNKNYAATRIAKYNAGKAYILKQDELPYGDPTPYMQNPVTKNWDDSTMDSHYSTTSFSIIDKDGNIVTVTQTINNFFGTGIVPTGLGFFLNDEMRDFTLTNSSSINFVAPYKQPASYMAPTVILKDGEPYATLGTPGGSRIPSALLQVILNMIEFDMDMQTAINQPRCCCFATSASDAGKIQTKEILLENGLSGIAQQLTAMGYKISFQGSEKIDSYLGGVQGIKVEEKGYHGGADPRRDGKAFGY